MPLPTMLSATRDRILWLLLTFVCLLVSFIGTSVSLLSPQQQAVPGIVALVSIALAVIIVASIITSQYSTHQKTYEDLEAHRAFDRPCKSTVSLYKIALRGDVPTDGSPLGTFLVYPESEIITCILAVSRDWSFDEVHGIVLIQPFFDEEFKPKTQWENIPSQKPVLLLYGDKLLELPKMHATEHEWSIGPLHQSIQYVKQLAERVHRRNPPSSSECDQSRPNGWTAHDNTNDVSWDLVTLPTDITPSDGIHVVYTSGKWTDVLISDPIVSWYQYCGLRVEFDESHWMHPPTPNMRYLFRHNAIAGIEQYGTRIGDAYRRHAAYAQSKPWIEWPLLLAALKHSSGETKTGFAQFLFDLIPGPSLTQGTDSLEELLVGLEERVLKLLDDEITLDVLELSSDVLGYLQKALTASSESKCRELEPPTGEDVPEEVMQGLLTLLNPDFSGQPELQKKHNAPSE